MGMVNDGGGFWNIDSKDCEFNKSRIAMKDKAPDLKLPDGTIDYAILMAKPEEGIGDEYAYSEKAEKEVDNNKGFHMKLIDGTIVYNRFEEAVYVGLLDILFCEAECQKFRMSIVLIYNGQTRLSDCCEMFNRSEVQE